MHTRSLKGCGCRCLHLLRKMRQIKRAGSIVCASWVMRGLPCLVEDNIWVGLQEHAEASISHGQDSDLSWIYSMDLDLDLDQSVRCTTSWQTSGLLTSLFVVLNESTNVAADIDLGLGALSIETTGFMLHTLCWGRQHQHSWVMMILKDQFWWRIKKLVIDVKL